MHLVSHCGPEKSEDHDALHQHMGSSVLAGDECTITLCLSCTHNELHHQRDEKCLAAHTLVVGEHSLQGHTGGRHRHQSAATLSGGWGGGRGGFMASGPQPQPRASISLLEMSQRQLRCSRSASRRNPSSCSKHQLWSRSLAEL